MPENLHRPQPADSSAVHAATSARSMELADRTANSSSSSGPQADMLPVLEERLQVTKQAVETEHIRVHVTPQTDVREVAIETTSESLHVERVPVGRYVDTVPIARQEGDVMIIPVLEEVVIIEKRLRLKEEIRITKRRQVETHQEQVELRRDEVHIERDGE